MLRMVLDAWWSLWCALEHGVQVVAAEALVASEEALLLCGWAFGQGTQLHGLWSQVER